MLGELYLYKFARFPRQLKQFQKETEPDPANANAYYKLADAYSRIQKYGWTPNDCCKRSILVWTRLRLGRTS